MTAVAVSALIGLETRAIGGYAQPTMRLALSFCAALFAVGLTAVSTPRSAHAEEPAPASAKPAASAKPTKKAVAKKPPAKKTKAVKKEADPEFAKRLAALKKQEGSKVVAIQMKPTDNPDILPDIPGLGSGPVMVAGTRGGIYTPPILSPDDILDVVNSEMKTIRRCYKAQLEADPEWSDELILDLSVKKTGRISEVSISPRRVMRAEIGRCLMTQIPKWKFPTFTGELDDGMTQEVVNASFPFSFSVN